MLWAQAYFGGGTRTSCRRDSSHQRPLCRSTSCQFAWPGLAACASSSQAPSCLALPGLDAYISFTKHYFYGVPIKHTHNVHRRQAGSASQPVPAGLGTSCLLLCALTLQLPVYVRGWVRRAVWFSLWVLGVFFPFSQVV